MRFPTSTVCLSLMSLALAASGLAEKGPPAYVAAARTDKNSELAHKILLGKARRGGIDLYFVGDSITRRWDGTDYPEFVANWNKNFFGWNAADFGWGGDTTQNILWRLENGELDGVNPKVIVILANWHKTTLVKRRQTTRRLRRSRKESGRSSKSAGRRRPAQRSCLWQSSPETTAPWPIRPSTELTRTSRDSRTAHRSVSLTLMTNSPTRTAFCSRA